MVLYLSAGVVAGRKHYPMPASKPSAFRRSRLALLVLGALAVPMLCQAARRVPVFVVAVGGQNAPALQQAMRVALVRATGRPQSATDPVFAGLVAQAQQYVVSYQQGPRGRLQVVFNGPAVDQAIEGLGRSVWGADRPFTLVVLSPMPDQADYQADHAALEQAAEARGLPISVMPLPVTDASGQLLKAPALLALVHRFGAEQLLVGQPAAEGDVPASGSAVQPPAGGTAMTGSAQAIEADATPQWRWTLVTPFLRRTFPQGTLTAGINATVDLLAPSPTLDANRLGMVQVHIEGVSRLSDYAHIELMLAAMPGVSRADVELVQGDTATFGLLARGGSAAVVRMLAGSPHFLAVPGESAALVYRYLPGPVGPPSTAAPAAAPAVRLTPATAAPNTH